jgi:signal transduction histidine kinase
LGLAIVKKVIEEMGGSIRLDSKYSIRHPNIQQNQVKLMPALHFSCFFGISSHINNITFIL